MRITTPAGNGQQDTHAATATKQALPADAYASLNGKLLDLLPAAVYFCDHEGVLVRWNRRAVELWGREPKVGDRSERFCGSYKLYRVDGSFMAHADCPMADALRTGEAKHNVEAVIERSDQSRRFVLVNIDPIRDESGKVVGAVNVFQDITERKQAETALRQSEQRFRRLLDHLPAAGYTCDAQGLITYFNRRAVELWGREPKLNDPVDRYCGSFKLFSTTGSLIVHDECWMALALRNERDYNGQEIVVERPDGSRRIALAHANPFHDDAGKVVGAVNVLVDVTERRQAEESLRRSEEHLRAVIETTPACIKVVAPDGLLLDMNSAGLAMVDAHQPEEVKGKCVYDLICDEYRDIFRQFNERVCRGEQGSLEFEIAGIRGTRRRVETHAVPLPWPCGGFVQLAITHDITERKRTEEIVRESEERFRATFHQAAVGVAHVGMDQRTLWINPGLCAMLGYSEAELLERTFIDLTHPDDLQADLALAQKLLAGELASYRIEKRYLRKNGSVVWGDLAVSLVRDTNGQPKYAVGVLVDITERRQAEARLGAVLASINDHLACYDRQWRYTFVNDRAAQVLGKSKEELLGKCIWELFPDAVGNQYYQELHKALAEQRVIRSEHYYAPFETWFENHIYPSPDGVTVFSADVTWRKRLEAELRRHNEQLAVADRRKDEFLATLAHELRNPLAPIRNSLQILKLPRVDAATARQTREMMERQVQHLVRLVDDLMDVSRVMRGKIELRRERIELATVIARAVETVQPLMDVQGHQLEVSVPSDSLLLDADPVRLTQVVGNLLTNAAKYTDARGHIWLTAEREDGVAVLRVRDNGIGIDPHMLPQVFELFVQVDHSSTKAQGGLGIGLTLSKNLVEMHGGTVEAHSPGLGKGCEFVVRLPLLDAERQEPIQDENGDQPSEKPSPGHRLLVVDDNQDAANSLAMLLKLQGHEVRVAFSGMAALEMTKSYTPDVVFLDIGMPGMDGYEVARRMRQQPGLEKVVLAALTGWGQQEDRRRTAEAGFNHHLVKPPESKALEDVLAELNHDDN